MESIRKRNESELELGIAGTSGSWHEDFITNDRIFVGSFPSDATEGDLLTIFEQFGTVLHVNLVRDKTTGQSKRFAFLKYEDPRSCVLAVDNFNGIKLGDFTIVVDHATLRKDFDINQGIDTTPVQQVVSTVQVKDDDKKQKIEQVPDPDEVREKLVKKRMEELGKKRKLEEKETKKEGKKKRKLERAKIREERAKRRAEREAKHNTNDNQQLS